MPAWGADNISEGNMLHHRSTWEDTHPLMQRALTMQTVRWPGNRRRRMSAMPFRCAAAR